MRGLEKADPQPESNCTLCCHLDHHVQYVPLPDSVLGEGVKQLILAFFEIFNPNHHFVFTSETLAFVKGSLILECTGVDDFE